MNWTDKSLFEPAHGIQKLLMININKHFAKMSGFSILFRISPELGLLRVSQVAQW